ncbi:hypothetical protein OKW18_005036 [Streptomyces pratensis]|nr:hypothetical protein [Streptomyces pratensis]
MTGGVGRGIVAVAVGVVRGVLPGARGGGGVRVGVGGVVRPVGAVAVLARRVAALVLVLVAALALIGALVLVVPLTAVGVLGRLSAVAVVRVVGVVPLLFAVLVLVAVTACPGGVGVDAVLPGVVRHRLGRVDRRRGRVRLLRRPLVLQAGDLEHGLPALRAARPAAAPALTGAAADGPAGREAAPEGERHVRLARGEGDRADDDHQYRGDQDAEDHTEEAAEGEQSPAQPRLVLQEHLAQQPQRHYAECDVEDRPAHARPLLRPPPRSVAGTAGHDCLCSPRFS